LLMRLGAQIQLSREILEEEMVHGTPDGVPPYVSPAEEIIPFVQDLDELDDILQQCVHGAFYLYRSQQVPGGPPGFSPFGVAYYDEQVDQVVHNRVYMVKRDPEHTRQILELGGWGQHPDDPWLGYHQWVSTNAVPWLVSPHWLQEEGELFPSVVQMVAALPVLRTLVDLDDPPWRPPPVELVREDTPEPDVPADLSLYDVWLRKEKQYAHLTGNDMLLRDLDTGAPVHHRSMSMRLEEKTFLPLSGAQVASMVPPARAVHHLSLYYPQDMPKIVQDLEMHLNKAEGADERAREALTFPKAGTNEMRGNLMILRASSEGLHRTDWRQRMFVLRDGVLCFVSEKKRALLKRVCDVKCVNMCTSGKIGPFDNCITMVYNEQEVENSVTLGTHNADDYADWIDAMALHSAPIIHAHASF